MHEFDLAIGTQNIGVCLSTFLMGSVFAVAAVTQPTRDFLVSLN